MKTITRAKLKSGFTQVPNETIRERGLSIKALGVLSFVLSFPDDWIFHVEWMAEQLPDGKHAIREALRELESNGIAQQVIEKDEKTKRVVRKYWTFSDCKKPISDFPKKEFSKIGKPAATNNVVTKTIRNEEPKGHLHAVRAIPADEETMMETIESECGTLEGQADTIANKFFDEMEKKRWKIKGEPIRDWLKVLASRIERTTGENILREYDADVAF